MLTNNDRYLAEIFFHQWREIDLRTLSALMQLLQRTQMFNTIITCLDLLPVRPNVLASTLIVDRSGGVKFDYKIYNIYRFFISLIHL